MRSYGQYCSVAKALDVIGDRWTLLVIRELLLQGPCRYTDLRNGLPGIATNLLSDRLRAGARAAGRGPPEGSRPPGSDAAVPPARGRRRAGAGARGPRHVGDQVH